MSILPIEFIAWYANEFKLSHVLDKVGKLLLKLYNTNPKTFRFFVSKFKEINGNKPVNLSQEIYDDPYDEFSNFNIQIVEIKAEDFYNIYKI
jgi:hypothetical protein